MQWFNPRADLQGRYCIGTPRALVGHTFHEAADIMYSTLNGHLFLWGLQQVGETGKTEDGLCVV